MLRKVLLALLLLFYVGVLFLTTAMGVAGFEFWFASSPDPDLVLSGLQFTIVGAAALVPLVLLRWWFKLVSWGTFSVLGIVLAVGCFHFGTYQSILAYGRGEEMLSAYVIFFWTLAMFFLVVGAVTFALNLRQIKTNVVMVQPKPEPRERE